MTRPDPTACHISRPNYRMIARFVRSSHIIAKRQFFLPAMLSWSP